MPIVSIDNEDDKNTTGSTTSLQGTGATEKVVIKRSSSAQLRAANKKLQRRRRTSTIIRYTVLTVVGLIMIYPLVWMVGATFKENSEIFTSMNPIPLKATFNGYKNAIKSYGGNINIWKAMLNTYSYVVPEVILTVISSVLTAYGFARFKFIGHKVLFAFMMAMLFLPQVVLNIPQYMLFNKFGWVGSNLYLPLIVPTAFAVESYFIFMLIQFLRGVPKEMEEAAQIDGCNSIKTLIKIIIPMILPAIVSCALFKFMWTSNDFIGRSS